jgi:hypothetical protein
MRAIEIIPPLRVVASALRKTTEVLASELSAPTDIAPNWSNLEWDIARATSAMHGVSSLLFNSIRWAGPESWQRFLVEQRQQSIARHKKIENVLESIESEASRRGVGFIALKGAALYTAGLYRPGDRPMGDIDLLIRSADTPAIGQILTAFNYKAAFVTQREQVFEPQTGIVPVRYGLGEHIDNPLKVEVHTRIAELLPIAATDITAFLFSKELKPGNNLYRSPAALMLHQLLHAAGNIRSRALRLIQLNDIALLARRLRPEDWQELLAARPGGHPVWWALAPLLITSRYFPGAIPSDIVMSSELACRRVLARRAKRQLLTDVSWSNIRVEAFPGMEWSRSPGEALQFIKSRVWPSRDMRSELKMGAAQIADSASIPWYGISHASRILRWVFSHPPRVQTLLSVRAALSRNGD